MKKTQSIQPLRSGPCKKAPLRNIACGAALALFLLSTACAPKDPSGESSSSESSLAVNAQQSQLKSALAKVSSELKGKRVATQGYSSKNQVGKGYKISGASIQPDCRAALYDDAEPGHAFLFANLTSSSWNKLLQPGAFADKNDIAKVFKDMMALSSTLCTGGPEGSMGALSFAVGEVDTSGNDLVKVQLTASQFKRSFTLNVFYSTSRIGKQGLEAELYNVSGMEIVSSYPKNDTKETSVKFDSIDATSDSNKIIAAYEETLKSTSVSSNTNPAVVSTNNNCKAFEKMLFRQVQVTGLSKLNSSEGYFSAQVYPEDSAQNTIVQSGIDSNSGKLEKVFEIAQPGKYIFSVAAENQADTLWLAGNTPPQQNSGKLQWRFEIQASAPNSAGRCYLEKGPKTLLTQGFGSVDLLFIETISQGLW